MPWRRNFVRHPGQDRGLQARGDRDGQARAPARRAGKAGENGPPAAHYLSWFQPRALQHALKFVTYPMQLLTLNRLMPQQTYSEKDISPYMWPNGKLPVRDDCKHWSAASGPQ